MKLTLRTTGFAALEQALMQFKPAVAKGVMRRSLIAAAEPLAARAEALAPRSDAPVLAPSVTTSTALSRRQKALHRKMFRSDKASVEVFVGAGSLPQAHMQEFGTIDTAPQPFLRPAWDIEAMPTLARLGGIMGEEIGKAATRAARRAAKAAKG